MRYILIFLCIAAAICVTLNPVLYGDDWDWAPGVKKQPAPPVLRRPDAAPVPQYRPAPAPQRPDYSTKIGLSIDAPRTVMGEHHLVVADAATLAAPSSYSTRYLTFYGVPPERRDMAIRVAVFQLNSLSLGGSIVQPVAVPGTNGRIIRFDFSYFCRSNHPEDFDNWYNAWEALTATDPYFREPWVDPEEAYKLRKLTASSGAVVRGDWFIVHSSLEATANGDFVDGFYSKFLGLPGTDTELQNKFDIRVGDVADLQSDRGAAVTDSIVAQNNRRLVRSPTITSPFGGYYWQTFDVINSKARRNVINNPIDFQFDGGEQILSLPNDLQAYYLIKHDAKKNVNTQLAEVPIEIANDKNFNDARVRSSRSCVVCHVRGINTYDNQFDVLFSTNPPGGLVHLEFYDPQVKQRVQDFYLDPRTKAQVKVDQAKYAAAVYAATGLTAEENARNFKIIWDGYVTEDVDAARAAWEFGVPTADLEFYLGDKRASTSKGALLMLLKGGTIKRDTFEDEFANGMLLQLLKQQLVPKAAPPVVAPNPIVVVAPPAGANYAWWIYSGGKTIGPLSAADFAKRQGSLTANDFIWHEGMNGWQSLDPKKK